MSGARLGRRLTRALVIVAVLAVGGVGGWALRVILAPAPDVLAAPDFTLVTAREGSVEQSMRLNAAADWDPTLVLANQATGVVTSVKLRPGAMVRPGDVLYTVDLRPVVAGAGSIPAFRDLGPGVDGADVKQLQRLLRITKYYRGAIDGRFGAGVTSAVREWQRDLGVATDGMVRRGDVVFLPRLPERLSLAADLAVGKVLAGGEGVVEVLPAEPQFSIALPDSQAKAVQAGMGVMLDGVDGPWHAEITNVIQSPDDGGGYLAVLSGPDGASICGDDCAHLAVGEHSLMSATIQLVPEVSGVTIPASAVVTRASGEVGVVSPDGSFVPVRVVASADGIVVVEGIHPGDQVRAPGGDAQVAG